MKQVFQAYLFISLVMMASLSVLSYGYGVGYIYIYWREWQIQTSIWVLFFILAGLSLILHLLWWAIQQYLSKEQRKREIVFNFNQLHPYEQLTVVWLLDAGREQAPFIRQIFAHSGVLKQVIDAKLAFMQGQSQQALHDLEHSQSMAFELAELQRIEIFLAQNDATQALTHLEFLQQHNLSPWLKAVETAYQQHLKDLWAEFALKFPWHYLQVTVKPQLNHDDTEKWLQCLIDSYTQSNDEQKINLTQHYMDQQNDIQNLSYYAQTLWLKLLSLLPNTSHFQEILANQLLEKQFNQEVFYLWFQNQLLMENINYAQLEQQIDRWEQKYPLLPIFSFSRWHIYVLTERQDQANQLLALYPEHILMNYVRLKDYLNGREDLIQQLNTVFNHTDTLIEMRV